MPEDEGGLSQDELDALVQDVGTGRFTRDRRYTLDLSLLHGCPCLRITGMVMQAIPDEFTKRLREILVVGAHPIIIDLRECKYLCSTALGALTYIFSASPQVLLLQPNERVLSMIRIIGWEHMLTIVPDEMTALAALKG